LYELLKNKKYSISHKKLPSFAQHYKFVKNNPYRKWYLILKSNKYIGSVYISNQNTLGINFLIPTKELYELTLKKVLSILSPLPEIKSIRSKNFLINCSPTNKILIEAIKKLGFDKIQSTYELK